MPCLSLHLAREIDRRWLQLQPLDRTSPLDRPKHPNDIRPSKIGRMMRRTEGAVRQGCRR